MRPALFDFGVGRSRRPCAIEKTKTGERGSACLLLFVGLADATTSFSTLILACQETLSSPEKIKNTN